MSGRPWIPVCLLLAAIAVMGSPALGATGSGAAGRAEHAAEGRALARVATITLRQTGAAWIDADQGDPARAGWLWSAGAAPSGYVHAHTLATLGLSHGRVRWSEVELVPSCTFNDSTCMDEPVVVVGEPAGTFFAYGTLVRHTCFGSARGPYIVAGSSVLSAGTDFRAPQPDGGDVRLTYDTRFDGRTVLETDTIARSTDLPRSTVAAIPALGRSRAYTVRTGLGYGPATSAPRVNACR